MLDVLKSLGIDSWQQLLEIVEATRPPDIQSQDSPNWCSDVLFAARDGWKFSIFYDCGELDYIDHFVTPAGHEIDFWDWPDENPWKCYLINWRGCGDLERLLAAARNN